MTLKDYHVHTRFCDGADSPERVAESAAGLGLSALGFSGHCYTAFDERYCMSREDVKAYRKAIAALNGRYEGRMKILCGIEQDLYGTDPAEGFDYVIGSVHYLRLGGEYVPVDESPAILMDAMRTHFAGDVYGFAEAYFEAVSEAPEATNCDIIGHVDLVAKFNEGGALLDEGHPRYVAAYTKALEALLKSGKPFEINTGAISRGYRTWPYPGKAIMERIRDEGGRFILNSDSHRASTLCFQFDVWRERAVEMGLELVDFTL